MKREETVLNVPFSVPAPTEEVLRSRSVEGIEGVRRTCRRGGGGTHT